MAEPNPNASSTPNQGADLPEEPVGLEAIAVEYAQHLTELGAESPGERTAKRVVPWIASAALHGALIMAGFLVTWTVVHMSREAEPVVVIADFDSLIFDPIATLDLEAREDQEMETEIDLLPFDQPFEELMPSFEADALPAMPEVPIGAPPADFSPATERGSASFMGLSTTNARHIVYVIDASGAMVPYLPFIRMHLKQSLDNLSHEQSFAIIFYQGGEAILVPTGGRGLTPATPQERDRALRWIEENIRPRQVSNPIPAFEAAMRLNPDVVFVLSANITASGRWEVDQEELLTKLDQLNPMDRITGLRQTQINCIQFLDPDPLETMRIIAERHGGEQGYRFFSRQDLGL